MAIKEIATGIDAPEHFIAKILQDLGRRELIQSSKGPNGGFYIDGASRRNTLADIVSAVDGDKVFKGCGLGLKICSEIKPCPLHNQFKEIRNKMHVTLQSATIAEFNESLNLGLSYIKER